MLKAHKLDAFITPGGSGAGIAARAGYPIIAVPFGMVPNAPQQPFPAGFNAKPAPFGVGFVGAQCSEPKLIEIAYAFEQATKKRVAPPLGRRSCSSRQRQQLVDLVLQVARQLRAVAANQRVGDGLVVPQRAVAACPGSDPRSPRRARGSRG